MLPNLTDSELSRLDSLLDEPTQAGEQPNSDDDLVPEADLSVVPFAASLTSDPSRTSIAFVASIDGLLSIMVSAELNVASGASLSDLVELRESFAARCGDTKRRVR